MTAAVAQSRVLTGTNLINTACQKYEEAVEKFRKLKANLPTLPTQESVTLILETQDMLREALRILDQATGQMPVMNSPEWEQATGGKETGSLVVECLQRAYDLRNRVDEVLESSQNLIQTCLAHQEARERYQTGKALVIVATAAVITIIGGAIVAFLLLF